MRAFLAPFLILLAILLILLTMTFVFTWTLAVEILFAPLVALEETGRATGRLYRDVVARSAREKAERQAVR